MKKKSNVEVINHSRSSQSKVREKVEFIETLSPLEYAV